MGDYGFKVARAGYPVLTASNQELAFSSAFNFFKVALTGTASLSITPGSGYDIHTIAHGMGYTPVILPYLRPTGGTDRTYLLPNRITDSGGGYAPLCFFKMDETYFKTFIFRNPDYTSTWNLRYYIFHNRIE